MLLATATLSTHQSFLPTRNQHCLFHGNFLFMDNKHGKLFVIKQSKVCKFLPKMHQNAFGGRAPHGPSGGANALSQTP